MNIKISDWNKMVQINVHYFPSFPNAYFVCLQPLHQRHHSKYSQLTFSKYPLPSALDKGQGHCRSNKHSETTYKAIKLLHCIIYCHIFQSRLLSLDVSDLLRFLVYLWFTVSTIPTRKLI